MNKLKKENTNQIFLHSYRNLEFQNFIISNLFNEAEMQLEILYVWQDTTG